MRLRKRRVDHAASAGEARAQCAELAAEFAAGRQHGEPLPDGSKLAEAGLDFELDSLAVVDGCLRQLNERLDELPAREGILTALGAGTYAAEVILRSEASGFEL
jgi:hypothetical protein